MSYETDKDEVIKLFDNHIMKYIVKDLEVLDSIKPDSCGAGACTIPQAISTFAALDLIGYLTHSQDVRTVGMSFIELLKNDTYFPEFRQYISHSNFFYSFRDNLRSIMTHRFSLTKYDITKNSNRHLFVEEGGRQIFNASCFTKMTLTAIRNIYQMITTDSFIINGYTKEVTMEKIRTRIEKLKAFDGNNFLPLSNVPISTTTTQTTSSLG